MIRFPNERSREVRMSTSMRRFSKVIDELTLRDLLQKERGLYLEWRVEWSIHVKIGSFSSIGGLGDSF